MLAGMAARQYHSHPRPIDDGAATCARLPYLAGNPLDTQDRLGDLRDSCGIGYCNITKCCTKGCPENIEITDNGIIPLKERVVDKFYDPFGWFWRWLKKKSDR